MKAVVVGGTGSVGMELVGHLLQSAAWTQVTAVGRREVVVSAAYQGYDPSKFAQKIVNMDNLPDEAASAFENAHSVFCTLGTTRKDAGNAEQFKKVDLHYVQLAAQAAKQAGVQHFSLCTVKGANANMWASSLSPFHALLYIKTKGQAEEAVKAQGFACVSIFRPGTLDRGQQARWNERLASRLMTTTPVKDVARAMVLDAEASRIGVQVYEEASIIDLVKSGALP
ncbi:hypothetical protein WJX77_001609 [Trebouxia sp. C0004]